MPWGYECRAKLVKQVPLKPTQRRGATSEIETPGPNSYETPPIFCGRGFNKIKRAPAYTFGYMTKSTFAKPAAKPNAPVFNVSGMKGKGGLYRITHCVVSPQIPPLEDKTKKPGPAAYSVPRYIRHKRPPAYSIRIAARPPYQPWDMWTPPPNMYHPPMMKTKAPAYTHSALEKETESKYPKPGPGSHDPNFSYVRRKTPAFSFAGPFRHIPLTSEHSPSPNTYCEKKFNITKPTIPAPSFGIRHSQYIGEMPSFMKSSKLDVALKSG